MRHQVDPLEPRTLLSAYTIADYFPDTNDYRWQYAGTYNGQAVTVETTNTSAFFNATANTSSSTSYSVSGLSNIVENRFYNLDDNGLNYHGIIELAANLTAEIQTSTSTLVADSFDVGATTTDTVTYTGRQVGTNTTWSGSTTNTFTVNGTESKVTTAGTYDTLKTTWSTEFSATNSNGQTISGSRTETWWLASGYGIVAFDVSETVNNFEGADVTTSVSVGLTSTNFTPPTPWYSVSGTTLTISGTSADDSFSFDARNGTLTVTANGQADGFDLGEITSIILAGSTGDDTLTIFSGTQNDLVTLGGDNSASITGNSNYTLSATGFESIRAFGDSADTIHFVDSAGDDHFRSTPDFADMQGTGFNNYSVGFGTIRAYANNGAATAVSTVDGNKTGGDFAEITDTINSDVFKTFPTYATMEISSGDGGGFYRLAEGFDRVNAYGVNGGSDDFAEFYDTASNDTFASNTTFSDMEGGGIYRYVSNFDRINAYAVNGGTDDFAELTDTSSNDIFKTFQTYTTLTGGGLDRYVSGFDRVNGYATNGGTDDFAEFYDTTGDDTLTSLPGSSRMVTTSLGLNRYASGFDRVNSYATAGGSDIAEVTDTSVSDVFKSFSSYSDIVSTGVSGSEAAYRYFSGYEQVNAYGTQGGDDDFIEIYDTSGNDYVNSATPYTQMESTGLIRYTSGYDRVNVYAVNGGDDDFAEISDTSGDDTFRSFATFSDLTVTGGQYRYFGGFDRVNAYATAGGNDTINMYDTDANDNVTSTSTYTQITTSGYSVGHTRYVSGYDNVNVYATSGGADDFAEITDSTGNDVFTSYYNNSTIASTGLNRYFEGFDRVNTYATQGGIDTINMYDTDTDDTVTSTATYTQMTTSGYSAGNTRYASGYAGVNVYATNGGTNDFVEINDTAGDDTTLLRSTSATSTVTGMARYFEGFDNYNTYATAGGTDTVKFYDTTGDDHLISQSNGTTTQTTTGFPTLYASGYDLINAYATNGTAGGEDFAEIHDTASDDTVSSHETFTQMTGGSLSRNVEGFTKVNLYAINGGTDTANDYDTTGNDLFRAFSTFADSTASGGLDRYYGGFEIVNSYSSNGGTDTAQFFDSTGNDAFVGLNATGRLSGSGFNNYMDGYSSLNLYGINGGTNTKSLTNVSYSLTEVGTWT